MLSDVSELFGPFRFSQFTKSTSDSAAATMIRLKCIFAFLLLLLLQLCQTEAFSVKVNQKAARCANRLAPISLQPWILSTTTMTTTTQLRMYNLPPSPQNNNDWKGILTSGLVIAGVIAFFASPLGAIFFALFNSLLVATFLLPLVGIVGYQVWQAFNTVSGPCPNCGAPCRVLKQRSNEFSNPSLCFNCGSVVRANSDNNGIELASSLEEDVIPSSPFWDSLFKAGPTVITKTTTRTETANLGDRIRRERTVIDVEVEDEDKFFQ